MNDAFDFVYTGDILTLLKYVANPSPYSPDCGDTNQERCNHTGKQDARPTRVGKSHSVSQTTNTY